MKCPVCGKEEFREGAKRCTACGGELASKKAAETSVEKTGSVLLKYASLLENDEGLFKLGVMYKEGIGVASDKPQALEIFTYLAERGMPEGMYQLSEMYLTAESPDRAEAIRWLKLATDRGHEPSRIRLERLLTDSEKTELNARVSVEKATAADKWQVCGENSKLSDLIKRAMPYVVLLNVRKEAKDKNGNLGIKCYTGSGYIVDGGYVITNYHVTGEKPISVQASFESEIDRKAYMLDLVAVSPKQDIAVLRFRGADDERFSARKNLEVRIKDVAYGEEVYTIGNALGLGLSVAEGIVSCPNRKGGIFKGCCLEEVIQIGFTVNHGNSGGALLDMDNNVIGMIMFAPQDSEGGVALCVPAKDIVDVLNKVSK